MKIGIYISGLGDVYSLESVIKYGTRMMNELSYKKTGVAFQLKTEKILFADKKESNIVTILEDNGKEQIPVYKFYDFKYTQILTRRFKAYNILIKTFLLFLLVVKKFPQLVGRLFKHRHYNRPYQTFYLFFLFFLITITILLMLPASLALITNFFDSNTYHDFAASVKKVFPFTKGWSFNHESLKRFSQITISATALLLIVIPTAQSILITLAEEFVCANDYVEFGNQSQETLGNLDQLVEYIAEHEPGAKIHFHSYSFGSLVAIDYLFPFSSRPSKNVEQMAELLVTIGTPVEFINAYYPFYYKNRKPNLESKITWLNVYSILDALGTNFRKGKSIGDAEFGLPDIRLKPYNIHYEAGPLRRLSIFDFLYLQSMQAHSRYWDSSTEGQSCLGLLVDEMSNKDLL